MLKSLNKFLEFVNSLPRRIEIIVEARKIVSQKKSDPTINIKIIYFLINVLERFLF